MAFPANVDGTQLRRSSAATTTSAISKNSDNKAAAWAWIEWFVEESGFTEAQGMISPVSTRPLPEQPRRLRRTRASSSSRSTRRRPGKESLFSDIADDSQIDLWGHLYRQKLVDIARGAADGDKDSYFAELNERWGASVAELAG